MVTQEMTKAAPEERQLNSSPMSELGGRTGRGHENCNEEQRVMMIIGRLDIKVDMFDDVL